MLSKLLRKHIITAVMGCMLIAVVNPMVAQAAPSSELSKTQPGYGTVNTDGSQAVVWHNPFTSSIQVGGLEDGVNVMIIDENGIYYEVQYNVQGSTGYVAKSAVQYHDSDFYLKAATVSDPLNFRLTASETSTKLASIPKDKAFAYVRTYNDKWYQAVYGNKTGYTADEFTELCNYK